MKRLADKLTVDNLGLFLFVPYVFSLKSVSSDNVQFFQG